MLHILNPRYTVTAVNHSLTTPGKLDHTQLEGFLATGNSQGLFFQAPNIINPLPYKERLGLDIQPPEWN